MGTPATTAARGVASAVLLRCRAYDFLSLAFRPPEHRQLRRMVRGGLAVVDQIAAVAPFSALNEGRSLLRIVAEYPQPTRLLCRELALEYNRLFVGPDTLPCPPYESAYCDGRTVMGPSALAVRQAYQAAQLSATRAVPGPPDHIAIELAFMAELCSRQLRALVDGCEPAVRQSLAAQRRFLEEHLGRWAAPFGQDVRAATRCAFYRGAAAVLPVWISLDRGLVRAMQESIGVTEGGERRGG